MIDIGPIRNTDIAEACRFLHTNMNEKISIEAWKGLFEYSWREPGTDLGVAAKVSNEIVGLWGCVYSKNKGGLIIGNPSSFYIHKDWRGKSIASKFSNYFLETAEPHYFLLSVSPQAKGIYEHWGYKVLETSRYVFEREPKGKAQNFRVLNEGFTDRLPASLQSLYHTHLENNCRCILISTPDDEELLILKSFESKAGRPYAALVYASGFQALERFGADLASEILQGNENYLTVDKRFFDSKPPNTVEELLPAPRYYYSKTLTPKDIQFDHSEVVALGIRP